jgi:predicted RNA-binding protein (virulence factor B family)
MKAGQVIEAVMQRIEPDALLLQGDSGLEIRVAPDLSQPFVAGKKVQVFLLASDEGGSFRGSLRLPALALGEVDFLSVHSLNRSGVFFDWGLEKPLFCPPSLVAGSPRQGMLLPVRLQPDYRGSGLVGSMLWRSDLRAADEDYVRGRAVELLVMEVHELGFLVLVDQWYQGLVYTNQVFQPLRPGQRMQGWVNFLRPDGKLDVLLRKPGYRQIPGAAGDLLNQIRKEGGRINLGDKSPADEIYRRLGMSKKVFKQAIGALYKSGSIGMNDQACWELDDVDD